MAINLVWFGSVRDSHVSWLGMDPFEESQSYNRGECAQCVSPDTKTAPHITIRATHCYVDRHADLRFLLPPSTMGWEGVSVGGSWVEGVMVGRGGGGTMLDGLLVVRRGGELR